MESTQGLWARILWGGHLGTGESSRVSKSPTSPPCAPLPNSGCLLLVPASPQKYSVPLSCFPACFSVDCTAQGSVSLNASSNEFSKWKQPTSRACGRHTRGETHRKDPHLREWACLWVWGLACGRSCEPLLNSLLRKISRNTLWSFQTTFPVAWQLYFPYTNGKLTGPISLRFVTEGRRPVDWSKRLVSFTLSTVTDIENLAVLFCSVYQSDIYISASFIIYCLSIDRLCTYLYTFYCFILLPSILQIWMFQLKPFLMMPLRQGTGGRSVVSKSQCPNSMALASTNPGNFRRNTLPPRLRELLFMFMWPHCLVFQVWSSPHVKPIHNQEKRMLLLCYRQHHHRCIQS